MKLMIASDLHFEFHKDNGVTFIGENFCNNNYDVLVLAGDIQLEQYLPQTMMEFSKIGKPVIFVPGNHEYYSSSLPKMLKAMDKISKIPNIYPLDNQTLEIEGQRFVGTTLWVNHSLVPEPMDKRMNCFSNIKDFVKFLGPRHKDSVKFLDENIQEGDVVITHYLPHNKCIHPSYEGSIINRYYATNLGPLVEDRKAKLWVHGHSHFSMDEMIGSTRVVRNPYGYLGYETNDDYTQMIVDI